MRGRIVRSGDPISEAMTAQTWNYIISAADMVHSRGIASKSTPLGDTEDRPSVLASVENLTSGVAFKKHLLSIAEPSITPTEANGDFHDRLIFKGEAPEQHKFGVLTASVEEEDVGRCVVAGVVSCDLFVPTNGAWIDRADYDPTDDTRLLAIPNGSAQILWKDTGTNATVDAIVRLGCPQHVELPAVTDGAITAGSSGSVTVYQTGSTTSYTITAYLDWMHNSENISSGKQVLIAWFPTEARWRIVGAECE